MDLHKRLKKALIAADNKAADEGLDIFDTLADAAIAECFRLQPMETAPKDGTPVVLYDAKVRDYRVDWYVPEIDAWVTDGHADGWLPLPKMEADDGHA